jgi:Leucine-rich repeat (LRR) protein
MASKDRAMNPTFAAAHGLGKGNDRGQAASSISRGKRLELIVKEARTSGKLNAVNAGLVAPLPNELFALRAGIVVDMSIESSTKTGGIDHFVHSEETLTHVDISDNDCKGSSLDERVLRYEQVQVMRWKRCSLQAVEVDLSSLEHLLVLDLSGNDIQRFQLSWLPAGIQQIDLSKNQLEAIESNNIRLDRLVSVDLSENKLCSVDSLRGLSWSMLQTFRCHHNPSLKECNIDLLLPAQHTLRTLDMAYCQLGLQGDRLDFSMFTELQTILLGFNRLSLIPTIPTSVTRLDLTSNRIEMIQGLFPDNYHSSSLLELSIQDNNLAELDSATITRCVSLRRLDLSANKLKTIPYQLGFLLQLQHLSLIGNPLYTFKASEIESTKAVMEKLRNRAPKANDDLSSSKRVLLSSSSVLVNNQSIQLSGYQHVDLMQLIAELKASPILALDITGQLVLERTLIDSLPDDLLPLLPNLTAISFRDNKFREIPSCLRTACQKLTRLTLSGNAIVNLDGWASHLQGGIVWAPTLTHLDLSSNRITGFPGTVLEALKNLQVLTLAYNKIKSIEDWMCLPPTLAQLDLSENSLENMDDLILLLGAFCPKLQTLRLHHNAIARIPATTGLLHDHCPALTFLDLTANPQHSIRPEILSKPTGDQLAYLKNRLTEEQTLAATYQIDQLRSGGGKSNRCNVSVLTPVNLPVVPAPPACYEPEATRQDVELNNNVGTITITESSAPAMEKSDEGILAEFRSKIAECETELNSPSLSEAKRYALKRTMAMEHSKLIREERRLGLRK